MGKQLTFMSHFAEVAKLFKLRDYTKLNLVQVEGNIMEIDEVM